MTNRSLLLRTLWSALGATAYIALIASIFAFRLFGGHGTTTMVHQMAALLLLVFSALVMGTLLLLAPARLYLDGKRAEGIRLLLFTLMWMGVITLLTLVVMSAM